MTDIDLSLLLLDLAEIIVLYVVESVESFSSVVCENEVVEGNLRAYKVENVLFRRMSDWWYIHLPGGVTSQGIEFQEMDRSFERLYEFLLGNEFWRNKSGFITFRKNLVRSFL